MVRSQEKNPGDGIVPTPGKVTGKTPRRKPYYVYRSAEAIVRVLPRKLSYGIAAAIARSAVRVAPARFAGLRDNLSHVDPEAGTAELDALVKRNVENIAKSWIDHLELRYRFADLPGRLDVAASDLRNFTDAHERGRGVVALSMHFGAWEEGLSAWNVLVPGDMALLAEAVEPKELFERMCSARAAAGVGVIPIDFAALKEDDPKGKLRQASSLRQVIKLLRQNGTIAIAIDRDIAGTGTRFPFFDSEISVPIGAVELAMRAHAAIVPIVLIRTGYRVRGIPLPELPYDENAAPENAAPAIVRATLTQFEGFIRDHPEQWNVMSRVFVGEKT